MKEDIKKSISDELRKIRAGKSLTQGQVAERCGVDVGTIVRYEKNNVTMQIDTISKILDAYNINIYIFFSDILAKTQKNKSNIGGE